MAHGTVKFFDCEDPFSLADWEVQNGPSPALTNQRAQALNKNGNEFAHKQYGGQFAGTLNYTCKKVSGFAAVPYVGTVANGWHIDNWAVTYSQTGFPVLAITCHKHDTSRGGVLDSNCRTYAPTFKVPACFGVPTVIPKLDEGNVFELDDEAVITVRGMTLSMSLNHVDEPGKDGEHFAGNNYDGSETIGVEFTGEATTDDFTIDSDWTDDTFAPSNGGNTVATTASLSISHHVSHYVPPTVGAKGAKKEAGAVKEAEKPQ